MSRVEDSSVVVQTVLEEVKSSSSNIEQRVGTLDNSVIILGQTISGAQATIESIHSTTSALMASTTDASHTLERLVEGTTDTCKRTEQIENTARRIEDELVRRQPMLLEMFGHGLKRSIAKQLRHQRKKLEQSRGSNSDRRMHEDASLHTVCKATGPANVNNHEHDDDDNQKGPNSYTAWKLESSTSSERTLTKSSIFGTLTTQTWTTSSILKNSSENESDKERKITTVTTVRFLPAAWIFSRAFVVSYKYQRLHGTNWQHPLTSEMKLRTVNVIPDDSEIFQALRKLDIDRVTRLLDEGRASPFDVDDDGRNTLGYVALGARIIPEDDKSSMVDFESVQRRIENLFALVDLLIRNGVDAGEMDTGYMNTGYNPVMLFVACWFEHHRGVGDQFNDKLSFLLSKLLRNAKSDPFSRCEALLEVDTTGVLYTKCGFEFHGLANSLDDMLSFAALDSLVRQETWPLSWNPWQTSVAISLGLENFPDTYPSTVSAFVKFWVTSSATQIRVYLEAKQRFHRLLLCSGTVAKVSPECLLNAIDEIIHSGGEIIALLTENHYGDSGALAWVRERVRKLILVREYMIDILTTLLLTPTVQAELSRAPPLLDHFTEYAQCHNARTVRAWNDALIAVTRSLRNIHGDTKPQIQQLVEHAQLAHAVIDNEVTDGWETDSSGPQAHNPEDDLSGWETEEEWEEDRYMLNQAKDIHDEDAINLQIRSPECSGNFSDYDEDYWSHVYARIEGDGMDSPVSKESTRGTLKSILSTTRDLLAFIV